jgi:Tfp pilus assembly protein PilN
MTKINLIAGYQEEKIQTKKISNYFTIGAVSFIVVIIVAIVIVWGVTVTQKAITQNTKEKIAQTQQELEQYKGLEETVISLEKGLAGAREILNGKYQWTKLLDHLEASTPKDVQYTALKLSDQKIDATLTGQDVNSLSRYVDSYKGYYVLVLSGQGEQGQIVNITTGGKAIETRVKTTGSWNYAVPFDPNKDQTITVILAATKDGETDTTQEIKYSAAEKKVTSVGGISATPKKLFSNIESKGYTKDTEGKIIFSVTMDFDGASIW